MELKCTLLPALLIVLLPCIAFGQIDYNFYISNQGKDTYPGTISVLPKQTILGTATSIQKFYTRTGGVKVGLRSGDLFKESLETSYPIQIGTYTGSNGPNDFAVMDGSDKFDTGWTLSGGTTNIYEQLISLSGFTGYGVNGIGSYSYIYVTEINRALEKTAPFTARRILKFVTSLPAVNNTAGSFYFAGNTIENPKQIFIHTTDGTSPNANTLYRYEVTTRAFAINSTYQQDNHFENLCVRGYGAGIGMLPGGEGSTYNKIIFGPGAGIHHVVVRSGIIDHSLFLPGAENTGDFAVVFYDVEGLNRHCTVRNSMFLDIGTPLYTHTSYGTNFGAVEMDNIVAFGDKKHPREFMFTSNNDTVLLNNIYADGFTSGYNYGSAKYASIKDSYFKDVKFGIAYSRNNPVSSVVNNIFIKTNNASYAAGIYMQDNTTLTLTNSIIHVNSSYANYWADAGALIYGGGANTSKTIAKGNIFICDIISPATLIAASVNAKDTLDSNVYILLKGNKIAWKLVSANGGNTFIQDFEQWKRQSGQDAHSLFFDLRHDTRGLKAIFADPANGNYDLANTTEGKQIAALHAGMLTPPTCFLHEPTYEEAADIIRNNKTLSVNACRNPCMQNTIRVNASFEINEVSEREVALQWNIAEQKNIHHYELQKATGNSVFKKISSLPVAPDSLYLISDHTVQPGILYQYRLVVFAQAGGICYSDLRSIKLSNKKPFTIYPNPSTGKIIISMNGYIGNASCTITNSLGQAVIKSEFLSLYRPQEFDLTRLRKGVYFLKIETTNGTSVEKFLLQ
ncbi:MAG: T9SS type A sorting domain-containing protein [Ginsengibacter sp.]